MESILVKQRKHVCLQSMFLCFPSCTLVFTALHYYSVTEMNRPWLQAITVLTKYLPAELEEARVQQDKSYSLLVHDVSDEGSRCSNLFR